MRRIGRWNCVILIWNIGKGIKDIRRGPQDQKIQVCMKGREMSVDHRNGLDMSLKCNKKIQTK